MPDLVPDLTVNDTLFDVYVRGEEEDRDEFAIGEYGSDIYLIERSRRSEAKVRRVTFSAGISRLADRVKAGFEKLPNRMYFNSRSAAFTTVHPDVDWKGGRWLLAATPPDAPAAIELVAQKVASLGPTVIFPEEIEAWREQQRRNAKHVVAFADHAAWPLALAQLALEGGWGLRSTPELGACPDMPPSLAPNEWRAWMVPAVKPKQVQAVQAAFGWTVADLVNAGAASTPGGLSALL